MKISLGEVMASKTQKIDFDYHMDLSGEELNFEHPFQSPVHAYGSIKEVESGVNRLEATVEAHVATACARCLSPVEYDKRVDVSLILARSMENDDIDDIILLDSDEVDIDEILTEELILDMETVVLCKEDCKGLCPKCGKNLNEGDCGCDRREIDPRLEKLRELLKQ